MTNLIEINDRIDHVNLVNGGWVIGSTQYRNTPTDRKSFHKIHCNGTKELIIENEFSIYSSYEKNSKGYVVHDGAGKVIWSENEVKENKGYSYNPISDINRFEDVVGVLCRNIKTKKMGFVPKRISKIFRDNKTLQPNLFLFVDLDSGNNVVLDLGFNCKNSCLSKDGLTVLVWGEDKAVIIDNPLI